MKKYLFSYPLLIIYIGLLIFGFYSMHQVGYSLALVLLIAFYLLNIFFMLVIFLQSRHSKDKMAWFMIIVLLPIFGHILFMMFGQRYHKRQNLKEYHKRKTFKYETLDLKTNNPLKHQSNFSKRGIYKADFEFFSSGNKSFNEFFKDIENAKHHIHMHYYIIKPGEIYDQFKDILIKKAKQGVEIRLILDDFGKWSMPKYEMNDLIQNGIKVLIFGKVFFPFLNSKNLYRTHRKIVIIDSKIAHIGGVNIADEYASLKPKYGKWIDLQIKIKGEAIKSHALLFLEDWNQMSKEFLSPNKYINIDNKGDNKTVLVEDSPEIQENVIHDSLLNLIFNAKKEIILSTPYFVPSESILEALKVAINKGVKIKIFVPGIYDKKIAWDISNYYIRLLMFCGVKFYRTKNIFLHTKAGLFDNKIAYIGTTNIDNRSFYSQFEFMNIFYGKSINDIQEIFKYYESISEKIEKNTKLFKLKDLFYRFFVNIFSPLI